MNTDENNKAEEAAARRLAFFSCWKGTAVELLILAVSGAWFTLAFPGIGFPLAGWTGIIPLLWLCSRKTVRRAFLYGFVWGYFWNLTACFFLREILFFLPFVFAVILGLFSAFFAAAVPVLFYWILYPEKVRAGGIRTMESFFRFAPLSEIFCCLTLSGWWVALEWIRSWIASGFPWNLAAATQWDNLPLIQICEYTGIYGVSFLVIFVNTAAFFALRGFRYSFPEGRYKRPWAFLLAVTVCLAVSWFGSKHIQIRHRDMKTQKFQYFSAGMVQPHLSQRRDGTGSQAQEALEICTELSEKLLQEDRFFRNGAAAEAAALAGVTSEPASGKTLSPDQIKDSVPLDVVIWPESAVPAFYYGGSAFSGEYRETVRKMLKEFQVPFLIGTLTAEFISDTEYELFNSAVLLDPRRKASAADPFRDMGAVYSKVHLVPYGEFVPLSRYMPWLNKALGMGRDLKPGRGFQPLSLAKDVRAGMLICYEDVFPYTAREQALSGSNVLVVITNDAWYPTSYEPVQHCANAVFRAVETRLPMIRCGNSNFTVYIDSDGKIADTVFKTADPADGSLVLDPERQGKGCAKFLVPVQKTPALTFYTRYGNVFVLFCWILFAAGMIRAGFAKFGFRKFFGQSFQEQEEKLKQEFLKSAPQEMRKSPGKR